MDYEQYPCLSAYALEKGIPEENLVKAFEIEKEFHYKILAEQNVLKRLTMYEEVYNKVHPLYGTSPIKNSSNDKIVQLFKKEIENKSILEVGCGTGNFLFSVARRLKHQKLVGVDISEGVLPQNGSIEFVKDNIINFKAKEKYDIVFSSHLFEHIAPQDLDEHLKSIKYALNENGKLIIIMPNRLFGPHDVTKVIDNSGTNKVGALGTHLNESTYKETIALLKQYGFKNFKTVLPIPRVRYFVRKIRINANLLSMVEDNKFLISLLRKLKYKSKQLIKLEIVLICNLK